LRKSESFTLLILLAFSITSDIYLLPTVNALQVSTQISFWNSPMYVYAGTSFTVNATLSEAGNTQSLITDEKLKVTTLSSPDGSNITLSLSPNTHGHYIFTVTPTKPGLYSYQLNYKGDSTYTLASSMFPMMVISTEDTGQAPGGLTKTEITVTASRYDPIEGSAVNITAKLEPPVPGAVLKFTLTPKEGSPQVYNVSASAPGSYMLTFTPDKTGPWMFQVNYGGDSIYAPSSIHNGLIVFSHDIVDTLIEYRIADKSANGAYIKGVTIASTIYPAGSKPLSNITDVSGGYTFHKLVPGRYNFTISKPGYINATDSVTIKEGDHVQRSILLTQKNSVTPTTIIGVPGFPHVAILSGLLIGILLIHLQKTHKRIRFRHYF